MGRHPGGLRRRGHGLYRVEAATRRDWEEMLRLALEIIALFLTLSGLGYYLLCLWSVRSFRRPAAAGKGLAAHFSPPVSILKPMRGLDPEAYENLRSHCQQDYPHYEIIFGVADANDPAVPVIERLIRDFPERTIRLVVCPKKLGSNSKVSKLIQMLPLAQHEFLVVNDSDIRVPPDYLRRVMAPLATPRVGMVTCPYRAVPGRTLGSRLEAIGISTEFHAGVLVARKLEGIHFGLGATLAFSRKALDAIGGFEPLADYLADDFILGQRIAAAGLRVVLSDCVVDNYLPNYSLGGFLRHQLRWGRTTRHSRPRGYAGLVVTFALPWAVLAVIAWRGTFWVWGLLGVALLLRLWVALAVGLGVVGDRRALRDLWLVPLRDLIGLLVWVGSYTGSRVAWRGEEFILESGKLRSA